MKVEWVRLGDALTPRAGQIIDPEARYPIAGVFGFGGGVLLRDAIAGHETKYRSLTRLSTGDVVYSKVKAFEGAVAVAPDDADGRFVSPEFPVFSVDRSVLDTAFLRHYLASEQFHHVLRRRSSGIGARRERVSPSVFCSLPVPLPGQGDQRRIAAHLDRIATSAANSAARSSEAGRTLASSVESVVSMFSGAPPVALGELVERDREWVTIDPDATYAPIGVRGFGRGLIRYPETTGSRLSKMRYYRLAPDRLLVSNIKAWEGAVTVATAADDDRVASNRFLQYSVEHPSVTLDWLRLFLVSRRGVELLGRASPGSADRNRTLSMEAFESLPVPLPNLDQQARAVAVAARVEHASGVRTRRDAIAAALLPAARNEIFSAMR